jgi:hypothetical protein
MSSKNYNDEVEHIARRTVKYEQLFQTLSEESKTVPDEFRKSRARVASESAVVAAGQAWTPAPGNEAAYINHLEAICAWESCDA